MGDFNADAKLHSCMNCQYGKVWTNLGMVAGNYCLHPEITKQPGLFYGRFHSLKIIPKWCPLRAKEDGE